MSRRNELGWAWKAGNAPIPKLKRSKAGQSRNAKLWVSPKLPRWQREHMKAIRDDR